VRKGSQPTTTSYDYRPYKVGNIEDVNVPNPAAGTWYVMLGATPATPA
jgi:serine protease